MKDYYKILGVERSATKAEIRKQFRKLATIHHPDKNEGSKQSEELFKQIATAYETLADTTKRTAYDSKYGQSFQQQTKGSSYRQEESKYKKQKSENKQQKKEYNKPTREKPQTNYALWIIVAIIALVYLMHQYSTMSVSTTKVESQSENRPESGEINFSK